MFTLFLFHLILPSITMKRLQLFGSFLFALVIVASAVFPAEVQALVPHDLHDVLFSTDQLVVGAAGATFVGINRKARGLANLGGIKQLILFAEDDFTADWPQAKDITEGVLSTVPPLKAGVMGAILKFDNSTCRIKSARKGEIGYQTVDVDGEGKFAGYEAGQIAAIEKTFNQGGVAIAVYKDGTRVVVGTQSEPLGFEDSTDSGAKADDKLQIDFKMKGMGYAFHPPVLAASVVIPLSA